MATPTSERCVESLRHLGGGDGDPFLSNRYEIAEFGNEAPSLGVRYLGVCGEAGPHHVRSLAEALCRRPPASRYSPDMSKHILVDADERLCQDALGYARRNCRFPGRAVR